MLEKEFDTKRPKKERRRKPSAREIHEGIAGIIKKPRRGDEKPPNIHPTYLNNTRVADLTEEERRLKRLYELAGRREVGGKRYFGKGDIYTYLEKKHGVSLLERSEWPDERIKRHIALHLEKGARPNAGEWSNSFEVPKGSRSRSALYQQAVLGEYFGHDSWPALLKHLVRKYGVKYEHSLDLPVIGKRKKKGQ